MQNEVIICFTTVTQRFLDH